MHVYPLDSKTKDGNLFWTLPKRPPKPIEFDYKNKIHLTLLTSMAVLLAKIYKIPYPKDFRDTLK